MDKKQSITIPDKAGIIKNFGQLVGSSSALVFADVINHHQGLVLIIMDNMQQTSKIMSELKQFTPSPCILLPDWETLPYDSFSPHQDIISGRLLCLHKLIHMRKGAVLLPVNTLMQKYCPSSFLVGHVLIMKRGEHVVRETLLLQLNDAGYRAVTQVMQHGEYAIRGALLDIFPMGSTVPYRVDFFDNEIDNIRTFDLETQRSLSEIDAIELLPTHEFPVDKQSIELFRNQWRQNFEVCLEPESIYQQVSQGILPPGIEYWQPLFFKESLTSLLSYVQKNTLIITTSHIRQAAEKYWQDINQRYESRRVDPLRPLLSPNTLWQTVSQLFSGLQHYPRIVLSEKKLADEASNTNLPFSSLPNLGINQKLKNPLSAIEQFCAQFCAQFSGQIIFFVESEGRREVLQDLLQKLKLKQISMLSELDRNTRFYLIIGDLECGFIDGANHRAFIAESDVLGQRFIRHKQDNKQIINTDILIRGLAELTPGKPVVHLEHGVGRYAGLTTLEAGGVSSEYLILLYANDTKLYVPISSLNLISRYSGGDEELAPLHKLGTDTWLKARKKVAEKIKDIAAELLDIYAKRKAKSGFRFKPEKYEYQQFCQSFPYEVTTDQAQAIQATINDMCSPTVMDRLICGDVGFGKTEVAMRAAFLAVMNHKQVAVLVPTTLLAQQHYENFRDRFANWPVRIETLSRFKTPKMQQQILQEVKNGKIDVIIGTHKLLQNDIKWHDLGLLIVDEEHRFGVRQKDRIKSIRANVDILTLTATPIPRTLNMAMNHIRDLSIIASPPARRLAIRTFLREYDKLVVREAILREILRGGQVYYLHNDVRSIEKTEQKIRELIPEARVAIAHGQMNERNLEQVMNDFQHQKFNILVCTTIIETGIDIPNANTIIIERADKFGLAQLHQLRGRVGRSYHQAYAYLLVPNTKLMTKDAKKRLDAIASLEDLGAGFVLATHDLEIRGAGELLGEEQSGQIATIGFTLYTELLETEVAVLKEGKNSSLGTLILATNQTDIELYLPVLIPDSFIPDVNTRLSLYKRIASAHDDSKLKDIKVEMIDRFGLLPEPVIYLLKIAALKRYGKELGISRIKLSEKGGFIEFLDNHKLSVDFLISLIQKNPESYRLDGANRMKLLKTNLSRQERLHFLQQLLLEFMKNKAN